MLGSVAQWQSSGLISRWSLVRIQPLPPTNQLAEDLVFNNSMEVKGFQKQIVEFLRKWDQKRNSAADEQSTLNHLVEEVGELATQYVNKKERKDQFSPEKLEDAIGDILMQTIRLADLKGVDVQELVSRIIKEEEIKLK